MTNQLIDVKDKPIGMRAPLDKSNLLKNSIVQANGTHVTPNGALSQRRKRNLLLQKILHIKADPLFISLTTKIPKESPKAMMDGSRTTQREREISSTTIF